VDERHLQRRGSPTGTSPSPAAEIASGTVTDWPGPLPPEAVLDHIGPGTDLVVPLANGDPASVLDAVEQAADHLDGVRVHQMHAIHNGTAWTDATASGCATSARPDRPRPGRPRHRGSDRETDPRDKATIQAGIGSVPNAVLSALGSRREPGVCTTSSTRTPPSRSCRWTS